VVEGARGCVGGVYKDSGGSNMGGWLKRGSGLGLSGRCWNGAEHQERNVLNVKLLET
jgi:hypothetical protein